MDSLKLFGDKPLQVMLASAILPGLGHMLLGKVREGVVILVASLACQGLASVAFAVGWVPLSWIGFRTGGALYLFAVGDSALLLFERSDGRYRLYPESPRRVAFWNLVGYGTGYEILGERNWAIGMGGAALVLHAGLAFVWGPAVILGEVLLVGAAGHAWWLAVVQKQRISPEPTDSCPLWLRRSLLVSITLTLLLALGSQWASLAWRESLHIRRDSAVAIEPFYENPHYGLQLEMPSPGWRFLPPMGNELLSASHLTEGAALSLSVAPRSPLHWSDELWALEMMRQARAAGWQLQITSIRASNLGTLPGIELEAEGRYRGQPRIVRMVTASRKLQHLTLWYEWTPEPNAFAATEVSAILASIQVH